MVPPYDDEEIMAGQGTAGLELITQCPALSRVIVPTSGGGLLSGLDRYLSDKLEIPVWVSETALTNVVTGCLKVLETPTALKQTLMRSK